MEKAFDSLCRACVYISAIWAGAKVLKALIESGIGAFVTLAKIEAKNPKTKKGKGA